MMSDDTVENGEHGTNSSRRLRDSDLSDLEERKVELDALAIVRAGQIQKDIDEENRDKVDALRRSEIGVYNERRSLLMLYVDYTKLIVFTAIAACAYFGFRELLTLSFASNTELLSSYLKQLDGGIIAFVVMMTWLVLRIYLLWARDIIYADADHVRRSREPIWFLGIRKISFQVEIHEARCNPEPTNFEIAVKGLGFNASSVDIDTMIQRDEPLHNLKYVKNADKLESIINS